MTAPELRVEAAFGHSWRDGLNVTWTDITDHVLDSGAIDIRRGRSTEFDAINPGTASFTLANEDRRYDPLHVAGPHYGDLVPGVPVRVRVDGPPLEEGQEGYVRLYGTNTHMATPHHASLNPSGDWEATVSFSVDEWGQRRVLVAKGPNGYSVEVTANNQVMIYSGGRAVGSVDRLSDHFAPGERIWLRATYEIVSGIAGQRVVYISDDGEDWDIMWASVNSAPSGSPPVANTNPLTIGALPAFTTAFDGRIYSAEVRDGIGGTVIANPDFTAASSLPFTDGAGRFWSPIGSPELVTTTSTIHQSLFTGYVTEWPQTYDISDRIATVHIEAEDLLAYLSRTSLARSVLEQTTLDLAPRAYWPLGETSGRIIGDATGTHDGVLARPVESRDTAEILPYDSLSGITFQPRSADNAAGRLGAAIPLTATPAMTLSAWYLREIDDADTSLSGAVWVHTTSAPLPALDAPRLIVSMGPFLDVFAIGATSAMGQVQIGAGALRHVALVIGATTITPYVNGQRVPWWTPAEMDPETFNPFSTVDIPAIVSQLTTAHLGNAVGVLESTRVNKATLAHVAMFDRALSAEEVRTIYDAGTAPWSLERTGQRVSRILDTLEWTDAVLSSAGVTLGPAVLDAAYALDALDALAQTERGRIFVDGSGRLTFHNRYRQPLAHHTVTDDGENYSNVSIVAPQAHLINTVSINDAQTLTAPDSIDRYGEWTSEIDTTLLPSSHRARDLGTYVLALHSEPHPRVVDLVVPVDADSPLLTAEVGDKVTFVRHPQGLGDPIELTQVIEGLSITATTDTYHLALYLAPFDDTDWWRWGASAWGTDTRWAY